MGFKERVRLRYALWGGVLFAILWMVAMQLFGYYIKHFANYSLTYGSLAAAITVVVWIYYSSFVLLLCAEFTDILQKRAAEKDKTQTVP